MAAQLDSGGETTVQELRIAVGDSTGIPPDSVVLRCPFPPKLILAHRTSSENEEEEVNLSPVRALQCVLPSHLNSGIYCLSRIQHAAIASKGISNMDTYIVEEGNRCLSNVSFLFICGLFLL